MTTTFPLSIRDVSPGDGFTRFNGVRPDGMVDGFHTGGVWISPDGKEAWKPLDGRPNPNADCHIATHEAEVLEVMADQPGFPRNWRVEERNGRRFLVRRKVYVLGRDVDIKSLCASQVLVIEGAMRALNARCWELNDQITVGFDRDTDEPFLLDLSAAHYYRPAADWLWPDESLIVKRWFEQVGATRIKKLRDDARSVVKDSFRARNPEDWPGREWRHVYASRSRPISGLWVSIPDAHYVESDYPSTDVFTWVVTPQPLDQAAIDRYELTWGWSPIPYVDGEG
jgi:hypothetical protein